MRVIIQEDPTGSMPDTRTFDVSPGVDHVNYPNGLGQGINLQTRGGHIDSTRPDVGSALMHDTPHPGRPGVQAVGDQYTYARDANGVPGPPIPNPGYENNIMGTTAGRELNNAQVDRIQAQASKVCRIDSGPGGSERCE